MAIQGPKIEMIGPALPVATPADRVSGEKTPPAVLAVGEPVVQAKPAAELVKPAVDMSALRAQIAQRLDEYVRESGRSLEFRVDSSAHATVITVRRADTGEVVRQFPTEEALAFLQRLNEQSGTFFEAFA
jgi:flagellar protein FlaG